MIRRKPDALNLWITVADLFAGLTLFMVAALFFSLQHNRDLGKRITEQRVNIERLEQQLHGQSPEEIRFSRELVRTMNLATQITREVQSQLRRTLPPDSVQPTYTETEIVIPSGALFRSFSFDDFLYEGRKRELLIIIGRALKDSLEAAGERRRFVRIVIEGHTDSAPIKSWAATRAIPTNWELSSRRATGVLRFFEGIGLGPETYNLVAVGLADTVPVASNRTEIGKAQNRRIVFRVEPDVRTIRNLIGSGVVR